MIHSSRAIAIFGIVLLPFGSAIAQRAFTVRPGSKVILLGKSNVNSWRCATSTFAATVDVDSSARDAATGLAKPVIRLSVVVPVKAMNCGKARMNQDMFRALKADSFPEIRYVLTTYTIDAKRSASDSFFVQSVGQLTVAGKTQRVEIPMKGQRDAAGDVKGEGGVRILMTDFGIKPPTAFFGAIRTRNAIEVRIEAHVKDSDVASVARRSSGAPR